MAATPKAPAYFARGANGWEATDWATYGKQVEQTARALLAEGIQPGQVVGILGNNRPQWIIVHAAAMAIGAVPTGIYPTSSAEEIAYLLGHTEAPLVVLESPQHLEHLLDADTGKSPLVRRMVCMAGGPGSTDPRVCSFEDFLAGGDRIEAQEVHRLTATLKPDSLATLIYTSGTTGPPKGVMLTHGNLAWTAVAMRRILTAVPEDRMLSYLPLSHIAEQMFTIHAAVTVGYPVYFAESMGTVARDISEIRPTLLFGVPRIWEKMHTGLFAKLNQVTGVKKQLIGWARGVAGSASRARMEGRAPGLTTRLQLSLAERLVFNKLRKAIGLDASRINISGAAPLAMNFLEDLASLGLPVLEVYGQSETCGPTTFNFPEDYLLGSVGKPLPGIELRMADDDEILVRGPNLFAGYYKNPEASADCLRDGWLASGDLGRIDARGFLSITGRKKEILITAGGKNIAPQNIEFALQQDPLIETAMVIGDRRKYLTALIALDPEAANALVSDSSSPPNGNAELEREVQRLVDEANSRLASVEQIKRFTLLDRPFSVEAGELTPTMKVKRKVVERLHAEAIEAMY